MRLTFLFLSFLIALPASAQWGSPLKQYSCDTNTCVLPDCHCASTLPPGRLSPQKTPQFIVISLDDALTSYSETFVQPWIANLTNPNGKPIPLTYYVNATYSEPDLIYRRYLEGHEITNHTATHATGQQTSLETWQQEISQLQRFLTEKVGLPAGHSVGFRAPYLATNEEMWKALKASNMLYDTSIPEIPKSVVSNGLSELVWPHTMDYGLALSCTANDCPDQPIPGLWTVPMWVYTDETGRIQNAMDPVMQSSRLFDEILWYNFNQRYYGNRAPMGIFLHAGQMWNAERQSVLHNFLKYVLSKGDVWVITARGLIEWMRTPVPKSQVPLFYAKNCLKGGCTAADFSSATSSSTETPGQPASPQWLPHPVPERSTLIWSVTQAGEVELEVFDLLGRRVLQLVQPSAGGEVRLDVTLHEQPPGLYIYRLTAPDGSITRGELVHQ